MAGINIQEHVVTFEISNSSAHFQLLPGHSQSGSLRFFVGTNGGLACVDGLLYPSCDFHHFHRLSGFSR
jgi:hypothetical protein